MRLFVLILIVLAIVNGCLPDLGKSGDIVILTPSDSPWHSDIEATIFSITAASPQGVTAFNDVDAYKENPYYVALPFNPLVYKGPGTYPQQVKNLWVQLINPAGNQVCFAQWEDVGPWFVDDFDYVFSANGQTRPYSEKLYGKEWGIYLHKTNTSKRKIKNRAGIDLSPATAQFLGINGKGPVHWRFVDSSDVPEGPWLEQVSTTPPHYKKNAPLKWVSNGE